MIAASFPGSPESGAERLAARSARVPEVSNLPQRDRPRSAGQGGQTGMFTRLGRLTVMHPWLVCALWLAGGAALALVAPRWDARTQDDDVCFVPERYTSVRAYQLLEKAFPEAVEASNLIFAVEREDGPLTPADFKLVDRLAKAMEELREDARTLQIGNVDTYQNPIIGGRLTSGDQQCTLIKV